MKRFAKTGKKNKHPDKLIDNSNKVDATKTKPVNREGTHDEGVALATDSKWDKNAGERRHKNQARSKDWNQFRSTFSDAQTRRCAVDETAGTSGDRAPRALTEWCMAAKFFDILSVYCEYDSKRIDHISHPWKKIESRKSLTLPAPKSKNDRNFLDSTNYMNSGIFFSSIGVSSPPESCYLSNSNFPSSNESSPNVGPPNPRHTTTTSIISLSGDYNRQRLEHPTKETSGRDGGNSEASDSNSVMHSHDYVGTKIRFLPPVSCDSSSHGAEGPDEKKQFQVVHVDVLGAVSTQPVAWSKARLAESLVEHAGYHKCVSDYFLQQFLRFVVLLLGGGDECDHLIVTNAWDSICPATFSSPAISVPNGEAIFAKGVPNSGRNSRVHAPFMRPTAVVFVMVGAQLSTSSSFKNCSLASPASQRENVSGSQALAGSQRNPSAEFPRLGGPTPSSSCSCSNALSVTSGLSFSHQVPDFERLRGLRDFHGWASNEITLLIKHFILWEEDEEAVRAEVIEVGDKHKEHAFMGADANGVSMLQCRENDKLVACKSAVSSGWLGTQAMPMSSYPFEDEVWEASSCTKTGKNATRSTGKTNGSSDSTTNSNRDGTDFADRSGPACYSRPLTSSSRQNRVSSAHFFCVSSRFEFVEQHFGIIVSFKRVSVGILQEITNPGAVRVFLARVSYFVECVVENSERSTDIVGVDDTQPAVSEFHCARWMGGESHSFVGFASSSSSSAISVPFAADIRSDVGGPSGAETWCATSCQGLAPAAVPAPAQHPADISFVRLSLALVFGGEGCAEVVMANLKRQEVEDARMSAGSSAGSLAGGDDRINVNDDVKGNISGVGKDGVGSEEVVRSGGQGCGIGGDLGASVRIPAEDESIGLGSRGLVRASSASRVNVGEAGPSEREEVGPCDALVEPVLRDSGTANSGIGKENNSQSVFRNSQICLSALLFALFSSTSPWRLHLASLARCVLSWL